MPARDLPEPSPAIRWKAVPELPPGRPRRAGAVILLRLCAALVAAILLWSWGRIGLAIGAAGVGLALAIVAAASTRGARAIEAASAWLGRAAARAVTVLLLVPIHLLVFTPASVLLWLRGQDRLGTSFDPARASYWEPVPRLPGRPLHGNQFAYDRAPAGHRRAWLLPRLAIGACKWALLLLALNVAIGLFIQAPTGGGALGQHPADDSDTVVALRGLDWLGRYRAEHAAILNIANPKFRYRPFVVFSLPDHAGELINETDGVRRSWRAPALPSGPVVTIHFYGGSTMWGWFNRDLHTIPSEIARLAAARGLPVEVVNLGIPAYVIAQEQILFTEKVSRGDRPDIAVFYDGFNELLQCYVEFDPAEPDLPIHPDRARMARLLEHPDDPLATYTKYSAYHMLRFALARPDGAPPPVPDDVPAVGRAMVTSYNASVDVIRRLGQSYGVRTAFFWQPTLFTKRLDPAEADLRAGWSPRRAAWLLLYQIGMRDADPGVVRLTDALDPARGAVMLDVVHTNEVGAALVARAMFAHLEGEITRVLAAKKEAAARSTAGLAP